MSSEVTDASRDGAEALDLDEPMKAADGGGKDSSSAATGSGADTDSPVSGASATSAEDEPSKELALSVGFDLDALLDRLMSSTRKKPGREVDMDGSEIEKLCSAARSVLLSQPMFLELAPPMKIVGDIHGQFHDLLRLIDLGGRPPDTRYLFLGDYVDRGRQSLETIILLLCFKVKYSRDFFLLRGNHECASINRIYGFFDECKRRYSVRLWKVFTDCFNCLPVSALIDGKILCMHGGLSPELRSFGQLKRIDRPTEVPDSGLLCDLLWSDPAPEIVGWGENDRGVSYTFGQDVVKKFVRRQDIDLICRAHQVTEEGYEFFARRTLVTLFSAPNYCGEFDNCGAMLGVSDTLMCSFHVLKPLKRKRGTRFY